MAYVKTRYRKFNTGGAVVADGMGAEVPAILAGDAWGSPSPASPADPALALKGQIEARQRAEAPQPQSDDPLANIALPDLAKDWLRKNPKYLYEAELNQKLQDLHHVLVDEGHAAYSEPYFAEIDRRLAGGAVDAALAKARAGTLHPIPDDDGIDVYDPPSGNGRLVIGELSRRAVVSAPPSREVPSSDGVYRHDHPGRITLTAAQKESARISGISEAEYAQQLIRLRQEKDAGNYGGGQ